MHLMDYNRTRTIRFSIIISVLQAPANGGTQKLLIYCILFSQAWMWPRVCDSGEKQAFGGRFADRHICWPLQHPLHLCLQWQPQRRCQVCPTHRLVNAVHAACSTHYRLPMNLSIPSLSFRKDLKFVTEVEEEIRNLVELANKVRVS